MRRIFKLFIAAATWALPLSCAQHSTSLPDEVTISNEVLKDKILGAWAGQAIGCTYGGPTEFKYATIINKNVDIPWHEHILKQWYDNSPGLYDDIYMDLTFVDVFRKEGLDAPVESFANAFANAPYPLWHANAQARYNILQGIMPPQSGYWENNPHADDIDFQIEADYAGIMAPGMPDAAAHYSDAIGHIMNYGDGWYGGVYMASMYSLAFVSDDMEFVVTEALKTIPEESVFYKAVKCVIDGYHNNPDSWEQTWLALNNDFNFDIGCPDGVYEAYDIDAVLNGAYVALGLLFGNKNFYRTIDIACRCGADSDCNPASAGGILGAMIGFSNIPEYWRTPVYEVADRDFVYTEISLNEAAQYSYEQALQVIEREGGKAGENEVTIKVQKPKPVRFEKSFEGHWPTGILYLRKELAKIPEVGFTGKGIVIRYDFIKAPSYVEHGYEAVVDVYVDGTLAQTRILPTGKGKALELFYQYNLPMGKHTVTFDWKNREKDIDIRLSRAIVYGDKAAKTVHVDE